MTKLGVVVLLALLFAVGHLLRRALAPGRGAAVPAWGWGLDLVAGIVALHLAMLALDLAGVAWGRGSLALALVAVAGVAATGAWGRGAPGAGDLASAGAAAPGARAGVGPARIFIALRRHWGDGLAVAALAVYAALAWTLRIATPDFVYHWGLKGHRYFLAGGIDWAFLADPLALTQHPDYPNLLPDLFAATAVAAGRFSERAMLGWSVVAFALLLAAAAESWARTAVAPLPRQAGIAALGLGVGMFAIGHQMAGAADWLIALAVLAALPPLLTAGGGAGGGGSPADDLAVGLAAALAAGAKIEGVPLALVLVVLYLGRRALAARRLPAAGAALRTALPPLLVVAPWLYANLRHGLFQPDNTGPLDLERTGIVLRAVAEAMARPEWHGLTWSLLLVPLLVVARRTRPLGILVAVQASFYLFVYLTTPVDVRFYVLSSLPRLLFHLVPAVIVGATILVSAAGRPAHSESGNPTVSAWPQKAPGALL